MTDQHADERPALGGALAAARQARGLSTKDVASAINLRETLVRSIERNDFTLCGGDVYARGHLRAYAKQVGLDAEPLLAEYDARFGRSARGAAATAQAAQAAQTAPKAQAAADAGTAATGTPAAFPARTHAAPVGARRGVPVAPLRDRHGSRTHDVPLERTGPNWALVAGIGLAVLVAFLAVQLVSDLRAPGRGTSEVAGPAVTASGSATGSGAPTSSARPSGSTAATPTTPLTPSSSASSPASGVAVALRATGDSWISVRDAAGRTVFSGLMSKGDARSFSDGKSLRLTLGNAGAVQLVVNGKSIGSAGGDGQVVRLRFGPGDPA